MVTNVDFWKTFEATEDSCDQKCEGCPIWWDARHMCLHESIAKWKMWNSEQKKKRQKMFYANEKGK